MHTESLIDTLKLWGKKKKAWGEKKKETFFPSL